MFYVFLMGLAKLHCGATTPSVMVLLKVPEAVYDSVLSLAEKQKQERANT